MAARPLIYIKPIGLVKNLRGAHAGHARNGLAGAMTLPDFFVIGAPKAGTTALHAALDLHPQLYLSPIKEPKFFLCDGPPPREGGPGDAHSYREWVWRRDDYERLFDAAPPGTLCGESTPLYLADFEAHRRIHEAVPQAKLIAILRDPVDRAYSNWSHLWADGLEPISDFVEACRRGAQADLGRMGSFLEVPRNRYLRKAVASSRDTVPSRPDPFDPLQITGR